MNYWLFKSEPAVFGIDDLAKRPNQTEHWDGVRNYQARNFLRDDIKKGDEAFFYHSSSNPTGIAGIMKIVKAGYPDDTAWDIKSDHYDPSSSKENPRWFMVDVKLLKKFEKIITLAEIKANPSLGKMRIVQPGNRLSITLVTEKEWNIILSMSK